MYTINIFTVVSDQDPTKFSDLQVTSIPMMDTLEQALEMSYAFQASRFGAGIVPGNTPAALSITRNGKPVVMADIKVVDKKFDLSWRAPFEDIQIKGVRAWQEKVTKEAEEAIDPIMKKHHETQLRLIDVMVDNGSNYCEPYDQSQLVITKVKELAAIGQLGVAAFIGPADNNPLSPRPVEKSSRKKASAKAKPATASKNDIEKNGPPFTATIFFAGIDPKSGLVLNREDVALPSSQYLRKVITSCQSANPIFMKGVNMGQAPILIKVECDGKLVALADIVREPVKSGYFVRWKAPLTESELDTLKSKATTLAYRADTAMLLEQSTSYRVQLEAAEILLTGTEYYVPHDIFMGIADQVTEELKSESSQPGW
jgi:hypothetical protein